MTIIYVVTEKHYLYVCGYSDCYQNAAEIEWKDLMLGDNPQVMGVFSTRQLAEDFMTNQIRNSDEYQDEDDEDKLGEIENHQKDYHWEIQAWNIDRATRYDELEATQSPTLSTN